jgi:hypothetical protein
MEPQEKSIDLKTQNNKDIFKVGNTVTFWMYYDGKDALREGTIVKVNPNGLKDIAIVHFDTGNHEGLGEVQIPIAKIALSKKQQIASSVGLEEQKCQHCGEFYEINPRLNDGFCDDCRYELNHSETDELPPDKSLLTQLLLHEAETEILPEPNTPEEIQARINLLRSQGPVAPPGVWIDCTSSGSKTAQVRWKSRSPCFTSTQSGSNPEARVKSQYIGIPNSTEHKEAQAQVKRRNEILKLKKG